VRGLFCHAGQNRVLDVLDPLALDVLDLAIHLLHRGITEEWEWRTVASFLAVAKLGYFQSVAWKTRDTSPASSMWPDLGLRPGRPIGEIVALYGVAAIVA